MTCGDTARNLNAVRIYFDHNATTPVREEALQAMTALLRAQHGNPSSVHAEGAAARRILAEARAQTASLVDARPEQVIFTSGATEANNTVIHGAIKASRRGRHVVTSSVEHPSVEQPLAALEKASAPVRVTRVPVDAEGRLVREAFTAALADDTALVSLILANNETGVVQDIAPLVAAAHERGIPVHVDATQALGKLPLSAAELEVDWLVGSAHKFNGPKGVGFLLDRSGRDIPAANLGGAQEQGRRGGTENLPGIVGLGVACELASRELETRAARMRTLRDRLWQGIQAGVPEVRRNGHPEYVLPNTLNVEFCGAAGEVLLEALDGEGVAVSAGAACHSGSVEPSSVLMAMGRSADEARGALRFSLGHGNDEAQVDQALALLPGLVKRVRELCS